MKKDEPPSLRSRSFWTTVGDEFWSFAHFCLARLLLTPLLLFYLAFELLGAFMVVIGAGFIAGGIYGLWTSSGRSLTTWVMLAGGIALPLIYYKIQIDGERRWSSRVNDLTERWDRDRATRRSVDQDESEMDE